LEEIDEADEAWTEISVSSRDPGRRRHNVHATAPKNATKAALKGRKSQGKKSTRAKAAHSDVPKQGRTYAKNDWVPPPPPAPFTAYQMPSFDACRIIYPGAKHDPWWDMPQLIAQVGILHPLIVSVSCERY
jgi:hypothetical protein